jgi:hypothetical protein
MNASFLQKPESRALSGKIIVENLLLWVKRKAFYPHFVVLSGFVRIDEATLRIMDFFTALWLFLLFFATSFVGVVTGSNSLVTVPVMFQFGVEPRVAVATNMFGLTFMAVGGALPFAGKGAFAKDRLAWLIGLTLVGSALGAWLVFVVPARRLPLIVSLAMIAVTLFTLLRGKTKETQEVAPPARATAGLAYALTLALAVYGGFYSGGYVTLLTALFVGLFRMKFVEAVATTKLVNIFSSGVATLVFMWRGLVDYRLGALLAVAMFAGAFVGARVALKLNEAWLRRIFVGTVLLLALKILLYDVVLKG